MVPGTLYLFLKILGTWYLVLCTFFKCRMSNADSRIMKWKYMVHCTWYLVQSLVKQIPTNPQIQEGAVTGVVWSYEIAFLGHQTGIQVIVLEEHPSSVDPEVKE